MYEDLFSQRLCALRMEKGVSAREMSLSLGQCAGYINSLENQKSYPSMQTFFYICEYLGVTPAEFFDMDNKHPFDNKEVMAALDALEPETRKSILTIVQALRK